jgi:hypothetical protein
MRKIMNLYIFPVFLLFCFFSTESYADTHTAASVSYNDVNTAVSAATNGDTVIVPAGSSTWSSTLNITKNITLSGSGIGVTNITRNGGYAVSYSPNSAAIADNQTHAFRITGFTFKNNGLVFYGSNTTPIYNVFVNNNRFENSDYANRAIYVHGAIWGVIYGNQFHQCENMLCVMAGDNEAWGSFTQEYGTENNLYVEDNVMTFSGNTSTGNHAWIETGQGGRVVVRYNTFNDANTTTGGYMWDIHGLQTSPTCEQFSTMVAEYYGNTRINHSGGGEWCKVRGGWSLLFNNYISGGSGAYIDSIDYGCDSCASPSHSPPYPQHLNNTYVWNNRQGTTNVSLGKNEDVQRCTSRPITENQDFYNYNASFNGANGVGCGPLENRPATCTGGVAYWATDQSCSSIDSETVGTNPTTPINGTLYKCTATNTWTAYYTPYIYPHPARREGVPVPASPSGLKIIN